MKVAIERVNLASLGRMGCLLGAVAAFLPSLVCGLLAFALAALAGGWLESWQDLTISFIGQELARFDLVSFFGLDGVLEFLQALAAASVPIMLLVVLGMALVSGILLAVIIMLTGLAYNLLAATTGGVVVEMSAVTPQEKPPAGTRE
jgi:FtsH-binding integral membrane protein